MDKLELINVLEKIISFDLEQMTDGTNKLKFYINDFYAEVVIGLAEIIQDEGIMAAVRMQASVQLRKVLHSLDSGENALKESQWLKMSVDIRAQIKAHCLQALTTQPQGQHWAARCLARLACVEIPGGHWPELIPVLMKNIQEKLCIEASIEAIGFICQNIDPNILDDQNTNILDTMLIAIESNCSSVRLATIQAVTNSLEFLRPQFENQETCTKILQSFCKFANVETLEFMTLRAVLELLVPLVKIITLYYKKMQIYIQSEFIDTLLSITERAMGDLIMEKQSIEIWSHIFSEEMMWKHPPLTQHWMKGVMNVFVPHLFEILEELVEYDEWNPHKAVNDCLWLLSQACEDGLVELVLPYVQQSIAHEEWRKRASAIISIFSILAYPYHSLLEPLLVETMPCINQLLSDPVPVVREHAAFTVFRVCEMLPHVALRDAYIPTFLNAVICVQSIERSLLWTEFQYLTVQDAGDNEIILISAQYVYNQPY